MIINDFKDGAILYYNYDSPTSAKRIYTDGSSINEHITAALISLDCQIITALGYAGDA